MQTHEMNLNFIPFSKIQEGSKTLELRLFDEKRRKIKVGDVITFSLNTNSDLKIDKTVKDIHLFNSFKELLVAFPPSSYGSESTEEEYEKIRKIYSEDNEKKYGVVAVELF